MHYYPLGKLHPVVTPLGEIFPRKKWPLSLYQIIVSQTNESVSMVYVHIWATVWVNAKAHAKVIASHDMLKKKQKNKKKKQEVKTSEL